MAKRQRKGGGTAQDPGGKLTNFAEDLGRLLGTAENKARGWLSQRAQVAKELTAIRDKASALLTELSGESPFPWRRGRKASAATSTARKGRKPGRRTPMSAAEKKAVSERMKKYWAERRGKKAAKKTTRKGRKAADGGG